MSMSNEGLAKLIEECGELVQVAAKKLAYFNVDEHPDGKGLLSHRLEEEMGDVLASIRFVVHKFGLSMRDIDKRADFKMEVFLKWDREPEPEGAMRWDTVQQKLVHLEAK